MRYHDPGALPDQRSLEADMRDPESRLAQAILPVLEKIAARSLSAEELARLEESLSDHGLDGPSPPEWMVDVLEAIAAGRVDQAPRLIPSGYPLGENGLANVLYDIRAQILNLGVDDQGEAMNWPLPSCGVTVFVMRETLEPGFYKLEILPYPERLPDKALLSAIIQQDLEGARALLAQGANPHQSYRNQPGPLMLARYFCPELIPDLLAHGADASELAAPDGEPV